MKGKLVVSIFDPWEPNPEAIAEKEKKRSSSIPHSETSPYSPTAKEQKEQQQEQVQREQEERRRATSQVAYVGRIVNPAEIPDSPPPSFPELTREEEWNFNYLPDVDADYSDLSNLNRDINRSRYRLFRGNNGLKVAQREEVNAEIEYRRAHARVMAGLSGGSEKQRTAIADMKTEEEYANYMLAKQVAKEYESLVRQLRVDLDSLAGIAHNIRAQMNLA